jgi:phage terminase small subunit
MNSETIIFGCCSSSVRRSIAPRPRREITEHGITDVDRFGQVREHPAVKTKRDAELAAARLLRELDLDPSDVGEVRPHRLHNRYG